MDKTISIIFVVANSVPYDELKKKVIHYCTSKRLKCQKCRVILIGVFQLAAISRHILIGPQNIGNFGNLPQRKGHKLHH